MGKIDKFLELEDSRSLNGVGTGTTVATGKIDWGALRNMARGAPIFCNIVLEAAISSGGAATTKFAAAGSTDNAITAGVVHLGETEDMALAAVAAKTWWSWALMDRPGLEDLQFAGLLIIVGTAALTGGTLSAWLGPQPIADNRLQYPSGFTVS